VDHKSVYVNDLGPVMSLDEIQDLYESYSKWFKRIINTDDIKYQKWITDSN
jgi:hypothetical protein